MAADHSQAMALINVNIDSAGRGQGGSGADAERQEARDFGQRTSGFLAPIVERGLDPLERALRRGRFIHNARPDQRGGHVR